MFDPSAQYELTICPRGKRPADEYYHQGQVWIEGREGSNYALRFTNRSPGRVLVIFSVDGLDVLKGKPAGHLSEGYVVDANSTIDVPGWKLDNETAAEFFFSRSNKSYVAKIGGNVNNTGVIGAMVFKEATQQPFTYYQQPFTYTATPQIQPNWSILNTSGAVNAVDVNNIAVGSVARSAGSWSLPMNSSQTSFTSQEVGTGFGPATSWSTVNTTFVRENATVPNAIMAVYYDSARNLQRMGIVLKSKYSTTSNNPFPAYTANTGAVPPPGWKP